MNTNEASNYLGLVDLSSPPLLEAIFSSYKAAMKDQ